MWQEEEVEVEAVRLEVDLDVVGLKDNSNGR
jgi:hypothetical protein